MSTKIYNGYKLPIMSKDEVLNFCNRLKPLFEKEKNNQYSEFCVNTRIYSLDRNQFLGYDPKSWEDIEAELRERIAQVKKGYREPTADFSANVFFIRMKDKTLALFYSDNSKLVELWQSQPEVSDYHYQNQVDKPQDISENDWEQRKIDWDNALSNSVPANNKNGIAYVFTDEDIDNLFLKDVEVLFSNRLPLKNRIQTVVLDIMYHYWSKTISSGKFDFYEASSWIRGDEGEKVRQEKIKEVEKQIKEYKTFDDLFS